MVIEVTSAPDHKHCGQRRAHIEVMRMYFKFKWQKLCCLEVFTLLSHVCCEQISNFI